MSRESLVCSERERGSVECLERGKRGKKRGCSFFFFFGKSTPWLFQCRSSFLFFRSFSFSQRPPKRIPRRCVDSEGEDGCSYLLDPRNRRFRVRARTRKTRKKRNQEGAPFFFFLSRKRERKKNEEEKKITVRSKAAAWRPSKKIWNSFYVKNGGRL